MPIGAYARVVDDTIHIIGVVISLDGARVVRAEARGPRNDPSAAGIAAARRLLDDGADAILAEARTGASAVEGLQP